MYKSAFIFLLICILNSNCIQEKHKEIKKENVATGEGELATKAGSIILITNYYDSFTKESEVYYDTIKKVKEGLAKLYYKNGKLKQKGVWHNNKQEGVWTFFYENGSISEIISFKNDTQNGHSVFYNKNHIVVENTNWNHGKLDGISKLYYDNGSLKRISKWINGKKISDHRYDSTLNLSNKNNN